MSAPVRVGYAVALFALAALTAVVVLEVNGSLDQATQLGLPDPGRLIGWGLPIAKVVRDLAAAVTIGGLVLAATAAPGGERPDDVAGSRGPLLDLVVLVAGLWAAASISAVVLTYGDLVGLPPTATDVAEIWYFARALPLGQALTANAVIALVVLMLTMTARGVGAIGVAAVLALLAPWPLATTGHSADSQNHDLAVNALAGHIIGISLWVGGLVALLLAARGLGDRLPDVTRRYSKLALVAALLVAVSGLVSGWLRIGGFAELDSGYGTLLLLKTLGLVALVAAGWLHRQRTLRRLDEGEPRAFARLALGETVVMALTMGVGVALGSTRPPDLVTEILTDGEVLLGSAMPPPLNAAAYLTQWRLDSWWFPVALVAVGVYLWWWRRLRLARRSWPVARVVAWVSGWAVFAWATSGAPGVYGEVLLSMHVLQHLLVALVVPLLLVLGAPARLGLRALGRRTDGSWGPREWLLAARYSPVVRWLTSPVIAVVLLVGGSAVFFATGLVEQSMRSHLGHLIMIASFLLAGLAFADVVWQRASGSWLALAAAAVGFVVLGAHLGGMEEAVAGNWFEQLGRTWGPGLVEDQRTAGRVMAWTGALSVLAAVAALVGARRIEGRRSADAP